MQKLHLEKETKLSYFLFFGIKRGRENGFLVFNRAVGWKTKLSLSCWLMSSSRHFFSPTEQFCLHWDPHSHWQDRGPRLNLMLGWNSNDCNCFLFSSLWSLHQRVVRKLCIYVVKGEVMITWTCGWLWGILCRVLAVVIHADIPVCEMI